MSSAPNRRAPEVSGIDSGTGLSLGAVRTRGRIPLGRRPLRCQYRLADRKTEGVPAASKGRHLWDSVDGIKEGKFDY